MEKRKRIHIIVGHYGSGKTEFAVNYAIKRAKEHDNIAIGDLDIVNPYFRSREKETELKQKGIRFVSSSIGYSSVDLPALSPEIYSLLQDENLEVILDVGGDPIGARVLGRYHEYFKRDEYDMWMVVNANRPETQGAQEVIKYIEAIENTSRIFVTGLINNTHMLRETTKEDVLRGNDLVREVAQITGLPIIYNSVIREAVESILLTIEGEIFPMTLMMRPEWL